MANIELDGANKKIKVDSGDLTLDVPGDIILDADGGDVVVADGGTNILKVTNSSSDVVLQPQVDAKDIIFKQYDGTTVATVEDNGTFNVPANKLAIGGTAVTSTAAELNILDGVTSTAAELNILDGVTSTAAELNILDGVTATASELNLLDGNTSVGSSITLADGDGFVVNDGGTMKTIPASDINTYASGNLVKIAQANSLTNTGDINIDNVFSNVYTAYRFVCSFKPVNSSVNCNFRWRHNNADLAASLYYGSARGGYVNGSGAGAQSFSSWGASSLKIADSLNNNNYNALHLDMLLYPYNNGGVANIGSIDNASSIIWHAQYWADTTGGERQEQVSGGGSFTNTTVAEGFKFSLSSGDFDGYNYALFGYKG